jgi:prevent-host-death family protein
MGTVSAFEAKTRFGELLERVGRGEEIVITRHDKPVARIIPEGQPSLEQARLAIASLNRVRSEILARTQGRARLSENDVQSAIEEGRQ